jgi:hypothetical protein
MSWIQISYSKSAQNLKVNENGSKVELCVGVIIN